jgi:hypothetical protein
MLGLRTAIISTPARYLLFTVESGGLPTGAQKADLLSP